MKDRANLISATDAQKVLREALKEDNDEKWNEVVRIITQAISNHKCKVFVDKHLFEGHFNDVKPQLYSLGYKINMGSDTHEISWEEERS